jgi:hypothetical protein
MTLFYTSDTSNRSKYPVDKHFGSKFLSTYLHTYKRCFYKKIYYGKY